MIQFLQKSTAALIIFIALANSVLIILIYQPQKVEAFNPFVWDIPHTVATIGGWIKSGLRWIWDNAKWVIDKAWEGAKWAWQKRQALKGWLWETTKEATRKALGKFRKKTLDYTVNHLTNYIQYGGRENGPSFIPDWRKYLFGKGGAADQAAGEFANQFWQNITAEIAPDVRAAMEQAGISTTNLCEIEPESWTIGLGLGEGAPVEKFTSKDVACTAAQAFGNLKEQKQALQDFYDGFEGGGWDTWLEITQVPQNNMYGFYLTVLDKKMGIEGETIESEKSKAIAGTGWLGKEQCTAYVNNEQHKPKFTIEYDRATGKVSSLTWLTTLNPKKKSLLFYAEGSEPIGPLPPEEFVATDKDAIQKFLFDHYWETKNAGWVNDLAEKDAKLIFDAIYVTNPYDIIETAGFKCTNYETVTPGQLVGQAVAKQFGGEIDWLMNTDEMEKYTTAIATAGINRLFSEGRGLLGKWLSNDDEPDVLEDEYQDFLAGLPTDSGAAEREKASKRRFKTAQKDYQKITGYQENLADDKKQEDIVKAAETPAGELLFALLDLENALKELKTSQKTLLRLQDLELQWWQQKALTALVAYHSAKNVYYYQRFTKSGEEPTEEDRDRCYSDELEREYNVKYDPNADWDLSKPGKQNPKLVTGEDKKGVAGIFVHYETIDLISKNLGKILGLSISGGYNTLKLEKYPLIMLPSTPICEKTNTNMGRSNLNCVEVSFTNMGGYGLIEPEITNEEREKIEDRKDAIGSTSPPKAGEGAWLENILAARDEVRKKTHLGAFSYLDLQRIYLAIYKWATSIDSQEKTTLTELELQGLERLDSIYLHLANWKDIWDDTKKGPDDLEESLNKNEYSRTQEFMEAAYCYKEVTCSLPDDEEIIEEARQKMTTMSDEAKQIYDDAEEYARSPESPSKTEIDFYKEKIGLNRFTNALEANEQAIINSAVIAMSSASVELNEYLGIEPQGDLCTDADGNILIECLINYWEDTERTDLDEDQIDDILSEILAYIKAEHKTIKPGAFVPNTNPPLYLCDNTCQEELKYSRIIDEEDSTLTLMETIESIQKITAAVTEKVADIDADLRELTFEKSSPDITPSAAYQNKLESIMGIYNKANGRWKECKDWLENLRGPWR